MTVDNPVQYEVELVNKLWGIGWASFRTAANGPGTIGKCDVVALKEGSVLALNVVILENATSTKKVGEENDALVAVERRANPSIMSEADNTKVGHAIKTVYDDEWHYSEPNNSKVYAHREYDRLEEVAYI